MKTKLFLFNIGQVLWTAIAISLCAAGSLQGQTDAPPRSQGVTASGSRIVKGATVYSIRFPGGTASQFFNFLRTNGFADDTILFAGRAGEVHIPDFTVKNVRLRDVAKAIELVTEDRLHVEVEERGEQNDVNVWRIKLVQGLTPIKTRSCAMPNLFRSPGARERVYSIAEAVDRALTKEIDVQGLNGGLAARGTTHPIESEKIVVVVGSEAYVEAVASALEAAEKVANAETVDKR